LGGKGATGVGVTPRLLPSPGIDRPLRWKLIAAREEAASRQAVTGT
jgi:phospholipid/cholesterol/gamma-HCH transport system ATP-binding protein